MLVLDIRESMFASLAVFVSVRDGGRVGFVGRPAVVAWPLYWRADECGIISR